MTTYPSFELIFPKVWSSTLHSDWKNCRHQFFLRHVLGLRPKGPQIHLHAGGAFAKGIEVARRAFYSEKLDAETATARGWAAVAKAWGEDPLVGDDHLKALWRTQELLIAYFDRWPLQTETLIPLMLGDTLGVECNFAIPLDIKHPETGDPILYAGTFDMLAEESGLVFVNDEKTASQLGPTWSDKWTLRGQFISYVWGAQSFGHKVAGTSVRGACFLKNDYSFASAKVLFPSWMIEEWHETLISDINDAIEHFVRLKDNTPSSSFHKNFGDACAGFGGCSYKTLCITPDPDVFADAYYQVDRYDPLKFHKE